MEENLFPSETSRKLGRIYPVIPAERRPVMLYLDQMLTGKVGWLHGVLDAAAKQRTD